MRQPVVLVTVQDDAAYDGFRLRKDYCRALQAAGALPLLLPHLPGLHPAPLLQQVDGLLLSGGGDPDPGHFGEAALDPPRALSPARDLAELALIRTAKAMGLPIFGICRGLQMLNIALGGTLYQDLPRQQRAGQVLHDQAECRYRATHLVQINGMQLQALLGPSCYVNSHHHQGIASLAGQLEVAARSEDGLIEAAWARDGSTCFGVQWHPECLPAMQPLFAHFVAAAARYAADKENEAGNEANPHHH